MNILTLKSYKLYADNQGEMLFSPEPGHSYGIHTSDTHGTGPRLNHDYFFFWKFGLLPRRRDNLLNIHVKKQLYSLFADTNTFLSFCIQFPQGSKAHLTSLIRDSQGGDTTLRNSKKSICKYKIVHCGINPQRTKNTYPHIYPNQ